MSFHTARYSGMAARPMAKVAKGTAIVYLRLRHVLRYAPSEFVFISSTPRSGSTLLSNILCSHPDICGYGETHTIYRSPADLSVLVGRVYWGNRQFLQMRERFVLEKIVWSRMLHPDALNDAVVRWIYLLRDPASTLRSCMEYPALNWDETRALAYYEHRLGKLQKDARHYHSQGHRAIFLTYEQLASNPQATLKTLSRFLDLGSGIEPRYGLPRVRTGGDQSERIEAGQIIAEPRQYRTELSATALARALEVHAECSAVLRRHCESLV